MPESTAIAGSSGTTIGKSQRANEVSQLAISQAWMIDILTLYVSEFSSMGLRCRLFQNNIDPDDATEFADFVECDWSGYGGYEVVDTWSAGGITWIPPRMVLPGPTATWTTTSGGVTNTVYGCYVTDSSDNLIWSQRGDAPQTMGSSIGQSYQVQL